MLFTGLLLSFDFYHSDFCSADMQCHCYVCDLPAPCLKWGTGVSITDHCHATEKVERWKALRKAFKLRMSTPSPCIGHPQQNQVLPLDISRLSSSSVSQNQASRSTTMRTCSLTNPIPQNHDSWLTIMRACSSSLNSNIQNLVTRVNTIPICSSTSNSTVPNGTNHGRYQESVSTLIRNRYNPHLVSRQLLGVRNNAFQKDRRRSGSSLSPQFSRFRLMSRGVGNGGGTLAVNHSTHGSSGYSNHINPADQYGKYLDATGLLTDRTCNVRSNVDLSSFPLTSIAQPSLNNRLGGNTVASVTQAYYEPSHFENSQNFYHSGMLGDNATSTYVACQSNNNQHGNGHQIGNHSENGTEAMVQCRRSSLEASHQEPLKENQRETARKEDFSEVDLIWNEDASQFIESLFQGSNIQSTESINQPPNGKQSDNLHDGSTCLNSLVDFENWLMEKDVASPCEIPLVDSGTLKGDFDTSWNGLTHA